MTAPIKVIRPQAGPQEAFLASSADIVIYGGSAGGGKTWGLLMEPLRHIHNPGFGAVFFRRNTTQIRTEGGLWDESITLYHPVGATPRENVLDWKFPSGATVSFNHLEHEKTKHNYQGAQIALLCFDELTHFSESQFFYMLSRNRSMCGVRPYVRATCNPDADSWVASVIAWWIDQETGYAIPERSGVVRYFVRSGDTLHWADHPEELAHLKMLDENGDEVPIPPKSLTFISAKLTDNKALMRSNPDYQANLLALPRVERERLLQGNWKVRPAAGMYFQRSWCNIVEALPSGLTFCRGWDLGASFPTADNPDPDWTTGTLIGLHKDGRIFVVDHVFDRVGPLQVRQMIKGTAQIDRAQYGRVITAYPQDPGQAGKSQAQEFSVMLKGFEFTSRPVTGDKVTRFGPFSAQAEAGNVYVLRGPWNKRWFDELENFPPGTGHDDDADSTAEAYNALTRPRANLVTGRYGQGTRRRG